MNEDQENFMCGVQRVVRENGKKFARLSEAKVPSGGRLVREKK